MTQELSADSNGKKLLLREKKSIGDPKGKSEKHKQKVRKSTQLRNYSHRKEGWVQRKEAKVLEKMLSRKRYDDRFSCSPRNSKGKS